MMIHAPYLHLNCQKLPPSSEREPTIEEKRGLFLEHLIKYSKDSSMHFTSQAGTPHGIRTSRCRVIRAFDNYLCSSSSDKGKVEAAICQLWEDCDFSGYGENSLLSYRDALCSLKERMQKNEIIPFLHIECLLERIDAAITERTRRDFIQSALLACPSLRENGQSTSTENEPQEACDQLFASAQEKASECIQMLSQLSQSHPRFLTRP